MTIRNNEPDAFIAGDTVKWLKKIADYSPQDGWELSYALVVSGGLKKISATDNGDGQYLITISASDSQAYAVGVHAWQSYVTKGDERYVVGQGRIEVKANFATQLGGFDGRSHIKKVLDSLNATLEKKATKDQMSYTIGSRSIARMTAAEIIKWKNHYETLYRREMQAEGLSNGKKSSNLIRVVF